MKKPGIFVLALLLVSATFVVVPGVAGGMDAGSFRSLTKVSTKVLEAWQTGESVDVVVGTVDGRDGTLLEAIEVSGGTVRYEYRYADYVAATVPSAALLDLASLPSVRRIMLDEVIQPAVPGNDLPLGATGPASEIFTTAFTLEDEVLDLGNLAEVPGNYFNSEAASVTSDVVTAAGGGEDTVLAIIDTGIHSGHFLLDDGRVLGGDDVSPDVGTEFEGFDRPDNHWHGSFVAAVAAGQGARCFGADSLLVKSIELHTGTELASCPGGPGKVVPLSGLAPDTLLVAYKVFPHDGSGVFSSFIDAAIERIIENKTSEDGFDIDVVNMSLGGAALFDGREAQEQLIDFATSLGLTFVIAAGNDGPASMTVASPAVTNTAITVAAAQHPVNSRVFWDFVFGEVGIANDVIVSDDIQVISFSSRGPAADGAAKPDLIATGTVLLSAFPNPRTPNTGLAFASGTSFSTPTVAGGVSLLNSAAEKMDLGASPFDLKEAVMAGADPGLVPGYDADEIGAGYLQVDAAWDALQADPVFGSVQGPLGPAPMDIADIGNVAFGTLVRGDTTVRTVTKTLTLAPGFKEEFIFSSALTTHTMVLELGDVELGANVLGIDSLEVYIHNAKRGGSFFDYYVDSTNVWDDTTFRITDRQVTVFSPTQGFRNDAPLVPDVIEPGFQKVVVENDWTSSDVISVSVTLRVEDRPRPSPDLLFTDSVTEGELDTFVLDLPRAPRQMDVFLVWENDWSKLPTHDLDLLVAHFDDDGNLDFLSLQGATLDSPELAVVEAPSNSGTWVAFVFGFSVFEGEDEPYSVWVFFE